jgi:hypothetical protein
MSRRPMSPEFDPRIADWLEDDPDDAPDTVLETVLAAFPSIPQRHPSRMPWRTRPMTMTAPARVAVAVVVGVLAVGAAAFILRPSSPDSGTGLSTPAATSSRPGSSTGDALAELQAYRSARDAVCLSIASSPIPDSGPSPSPAALVSFLQSTIARGNEEATRLAAIQAPPALASEHLANIQTLKDVLALLQREIDLVQSNKLAEAATVDEATGSLSGLFEQFEAKYGLQPCP